MKALWSLLAFVCLSAPAMAGDSIPDYIRYAEDAASARLEVAIKTFALPSGQTVDLIGAVHIADDAYFQDLNGRFGTYDAVLFELVGDPRRLTSAAPAAQRFRSGGGAIGFIQQAASKYLNLTFQLGAVDYSGANMVHADMSAEEFARQQQARGESMATLFVRAMQVQASGAFDQAAMNELDTLGLLRILVSPDSATAFKKSLAKMFDQMESVTAAIEGEAGSAILSERNAVAFKKLEEVLADRKRRRVALFYGGAHMPGLEALLVGQLKAKASGEQWLAAWTMKKVPATRVPVSQ
jgi:hypothetical protein